MNLEDVARGLGFTKIERSGNDIIRWERVERYLNDLGFAPTSGRNRFIPENIFYRLAMKAKNAAAEAFQAKVADDGVRGHLPPGQKFCKVFTLGHRRGARLASYFVSRAIQTIGNKCWLLNRQKQMI